MLILFRQRQGQSVIGQYALVFSLVIAVVTAMTVYVRRALQGRIYDAKTYMIDTLASGGGVSVSQQYEPYYLHRESNKFASQDDMVALKGGTYSQKGTQTTNVNSETFQ